MAVGAAAPTGFAEDTSMSTRTPPRVKILVAGTTVLAALLTIASWTSPDPGTLLFWAAISVVAELMWIRLPAGSATLSMASCSQLALALTLPRGPAMALTAATGALVEALVLRKPASRVLFNASQSALAVGAASWLYATLAGGTPLLVLLARGELLPLVLAAGAYFAVNTGAVSLAIAWCDGAHPVAVWRMNFGRGYDLLGSAAVLSLGVLLASLHAATGMLGTVLVAFPLVLAHQGYRRITARRGQRGEPAPEARAA